MNSENESAAQVEVGLESPGGALVRLRESRNLTAAEVAQQLKYGVRQIEALEQDNFERLSGTTFVRGMIRSYAKLLGADPEPILSQFERQDISGPMTVDLRAPQIPFPDKSRRATRTYAVFSAVAIVVAGLVAFEMHSGVSLLASFQVNTPDPEPQISFTETVKPASETRRLDPIVGPETPRRPNLETTNTTAATVFEIKPRIDRSAGLQSSIKRISLQFDRESWVEIKQGDGKTLLSQLNPAGTQQYVEGVPPFLLTIGNAPSVHVKYGDQPVDLRPHFKVDVARLTLE